MHVFILVFLLYITVIKSEHNDTKYIDMLPEKEKEEFLEKIARRILEEVEIKNEKLNDSTEVSDKLLDQHDEFVRKILQEESANLRKQANDTDANPNSLYVPPVLREEKNQQQQYVDLTLRTDKNRTKRDSYRKVFTGYVSDNDNSTENVKDNPEESELDVQVRNFRRSVDSNDNIKLDENDLSETQTEETQTQTKIHNNQTDYNISTSSIHIEEDIKPQAEMITMKVIDDETMYTTKIYSSEIYKTSDSSSSYDTVETSTIDSTVNFFTGEETPTEKIPYDLIKKTFDPLGNTSFEDAQIKSENRHNQNDSLKAHSQKNLEETVTVLSSSTTENGSSTENNNENLRQSVETTTIKSTNLIYSGNDSSVINIDVITITPPHNLKPNEDKTEKQPEELTTSATEVLITSTDINYNQTFNVNALSNKNKSGNEELNSLTTNVIQNINVLNNTKATIQNKSVSNITRPTKVLFSKIMKALKEKMQIIGKKPEDNSYSKPPFKEYRVYEISPNVSPFVKKEDPKKKLLQKSKTLPKPDKAIPKIIQLKSILKKEEPTLRVEVKEASHYVPIYNYLPENAFYNSNNKDDANEDDDEPSDKTGTKILSSIQPDTNDNTEESADNELNNQQKSVPVYIYSPENAFYNPKDVYGLNEEDQTVIKDNNNDINPEDDYTKDNDDNENTNIRDQWQHYDDTLKINSKTDQVLELQKQQKNGKLTLASLTEIVKDLVLAGKKKDKNIKVKSGHIDNILSKNLDWSSKKPKALLRCLYKNKCGQGNGDDSDEKSKEDDNITDYENMFDTTMSKARHMLLTSGHFMIAKKEDHLGLDHYLKSAEEDNDTKEDKEKKIDKDNKQDRKLKRVIRALLEENDLQDRESSEKEHNIDIAMDYYFDDPKSKRDRIHKDNKTPKFAVIVNKNSPKKVSNEAKTLRIQIPPKTTDKYYEYLLIKDLANELPDEDIEKLYWQLELIEKLNLRQNNERNDSKELNAFIEVLGDMVKENNKGLIKYDWLATAVELQSAVKKISDMIVSIQNEKSIHPSDLELLKYLVWLHHNAEDQLNLGSQPKPLRGIKLTPNKTNRPKNIKGSFDFRAWINRFRPKPIPDEEMDSFQEFLDHLQNSLYDLHTALKYIALVTKYKNQRWFENLQQIHLEVSRKNILELIIHLSSTRLLGMIEESAKNGLEDNFKKYVLAKKNEKEVDSAVQEFVFVLKLLNEYKNVK